MMTIQYKPQGFPDTIECNCGNTLTLREMIMNADKQKTVVDEDVFDNEYFSGVICNSCQLRIWYVYLDYSSSVRTISLITPESLSLDPDPVSEEKMKTLQEIQNSLSETYDIFLDFPADLIVTEYISHHEIDHIIDDIFPTLPLLLFESKTPHDDNLIIVIPYEANNDIYGEIKVNFNISTEEREAIADLAFGIWDLVDDHYFGPIHQITWDIETLLS